MRETTAVQIFLSVASILVSAQSFAQTPTPTPTLQPTYQSIRDNIFVAKCLTCHGQGPTGTAVPLGDYTQLLAAMKGTVVVPGNPGKSSLVSAITSGSMPPAKSAIPAVTAAELSTIQTWIQNGAVQQ